MPNVTAGVFGRMVLEFERNKTADAVIPLDRPGNPQPLCAIFRPAACLAAIERLSKDRTPAVKDMLRELNVIAVEFSEFAHLPDAESLFANLNTPDDLRAQSK
jgi:molybdopterin-guanine dinucleotide biosynthesis protein A